MINWASGLIGLAIWLALGVSVPMIVYVYGRITGHDD